jgi:hypothetical protein
MRRAREDRTRSHSTRKKPRGCRRSPQPLALARSSTGEGHCLSERAISGARGRRSTWASVEDWFLAPRVASPWTPTSRRLSDGPPSTAFCMPSKGHVRRWCPIFATRFCLGLARSPCNRWPARILCSLSLRRCRLRVTHGNTGSCAHCAPLSLEPATRYMIFSSRGRLAITSSRETKALPGRQTFRRPLRWTGSPGLCLPAGTHSGTSTLNQQLPF